MHAADRRKAIVDAAVRLFAERGFRGTTTRDIAASVGVTEPVLYQHFRTKSELYRAILEAKAREGSEKTIAALERYSRSSDDRGFFTQLATLILDQYAKDPDFMRLLFHSALEGGELSEYFFRDYVQCLHELVTGYISRRARARAFRKIDSLLACRAFIGMAVQLSMAEVIFHRKKVRMSRARIAASLADVCLNGIAGSRNGKS
jgi:TetR/AcrR family transcriptional regulator